MSGRDDVLFQVGLDLSALQNLFECVNHQAQIIINDGDPDTENYGLILEAVAEKGMREADAAMGRLNKAGMKTKKQAAAPAPIAEAAGNTSKPH
jgi:hypothetical protein